MCIDFGQRNAVFLKRPLTARRLAVWAESFAPVPEPGYDLTHSFNAVPTMTRRPYIVSFESYLPRFPADHDHGILTRPLDLLEEHLRARLADDRCIACLAYSQYAQRQFRHQAAGSRHRAAIEAKLRVRYPAFPLRRTTPKPARASSSSCSPATTSCARAGPCCYAPTSGCAPPASPSRRRSSRRSAGIRRTTSARARPRSSSASCSASRRPAWSTSGASRTRACWS